MCNLLRFFLFLVIFCYFEVVNSGILSVIESKFHKEKQELSKDLYSKNKNSVQFYLFSNTYDLSSAYELIDGNKDNLQNSGFNYKLPVVVLIHGFKNNYTSGFGRTLVKAYISTSYPANIIGANWDGAIPYDGNKLVEDMLYSKAVNAVPNAAQLVAQFLKFLLAEKAIANPANIHIVGFSLGAHVAGLTGKIVQADGDFSKIGRITGLDPAGPLFTNKDNNHRLYKTDATFVDVIHTNRGRKGIDTNLGHVDFYPNGGGPSQPDCKTEGILGTCSHAAAYKYFGKSILDKTFKACKCDQNSEVELQIDTCGKAEWHGDCKDQVIFGEYCPATANGVYFLTISNI